MDEALKKIKLLKLSVFRNPVILHNILDHLNIEDLKTCRLISKKWKNIATPLLGTRSFLCFSNYHLEMDKHQLVESLAMDKRLVRTIDLVYCQYPEADPTDRDIQLLDQHYYSACVIYKKKLQEIEMHVDVKFFSMLVSLLEHHNFPKLQKLVLFQLNHKEILDAEEVGGETLCPIVKPIPSIQILELGQTDSNFQSHPLFQQLISACPNLQRLKIMGNFYPDLSKCSKLKDLTWSGFPYKKSSDPNGKDILVHRMDFKFSKLLDLLYSVKKSLEILELESLYTLDEYLNLQLDLNGLQSGPFFPVNTFPKLRTLTIEDLVVYDDFAELLDPSQFPNLEKLTLGWERTDFDYCYQNEFYFPKEKDSFLPLTTVEFLTLAKSSIPEIIRSLSFLVQVVPNVKDIVVSLISRDQSDWIAEDGPMSDDELGGMNQIFTAFDFLQHATIHIYFQCTLSQLMQHILGHTQKGLTSLKLILDDPMLITDDGCNNFQKVFVLCKNITFVGFLFRGGTVCRMNTFALVENVHLHFID